jgi:STE24 endopeptidase
MDPSIKSYQRRKITAMLASTTLHVVVLAAFAVAVGPSLDQPVRDWVGESRWLQLLMHAFLLGATIEALSAPLDFWSGYVIEHRYHLSNLTVGKWIWRRVKGYLVGGVLGGLLLLGLYAVLWNAGAWWWLWATAGWLLVTLVLGRLVPVLILPLFYKVTRLDDEPLLDRLRKLTEGTTLGIEGVYRLHLSEETKKANAALAGLGKTRRVLLGDTLLEKFTPEEIEVVFAHEVGHHVHRHLLQMIVLRVMLSLAGFWLVDRILQGAAPTLGYGAWDTPAALPLLLLVLSLFGLALTPVQNAISRFYEVQCDTYALRRTSNPGAYRSTFQKLAEMNKADPNPHPLVEWFLYDHPAIAKRIALADSVRVQSG